MTKKIIYIVGASLLTLIVILSTVFGLGASGVVSITGEKERLVFTSANIDTVYDGTEKTNSKCELVSGELKEGHVIKYAVSGSRTDAGKSENSFTVSITDKKGKDVTERYSIEYQYGYININARPIELTATSQTKVYDGTPLTSEEYVISSGTLVAEHSASLEFTGSQTNVGKSDNVINASIVDSNKNDVSSNYSITTKLGTLEVTKRPITLTSKSYECVYDGLGHSYEDFDVTSGSLVEGHIFSEVFDAEITNVGTLENKFSVSITAADGTDATDNYDITYEYGTLKINPRVIKLEASSLKDIYYDAQEHSKEEYSIISGSTIYGHSLQVSDFTVRINAGTYDNTFTAKVYDNAGIDVTTNYKIIINPGKLVINPRPITLKSDDDIQPIYDGKTHSANNASIILGSLLSGHYVKYTWNDGYINAGTYSNTFSAEIFDANNSNITQNYQITTVYGEIRINKRAITLESESKTFIYDGNPHNNDVFRLVEGHIVSGQSIKSHFNNGFINANTYENTFTVTISDSMDNDVTHNYTISYVYGNVVINRRAITIKSNGSTWVYDAEPHYKNSDSDISIIVGELAATDTIYFIDFNTSIVNVGKKDNFFSLQIINSNGEDVTKNYEITKEYGSLEITPREIVISTQSKTQIYSATEMICHEFAVENPADLVSGHTIKDVIFLSTAVTKDVGEVLNEIASIKILSGEDDVTSNYSIVYHFGKLITTPREITIRTEDQSKFYDGTPLTHHVWNIVSITKEVEGHVITVAVSGTITEPGSAYNTIAEVLIMSGEENVTRNYLITKEYGILTVKQTYETPDNPSTPGGDDPSENPDGSYTIGSPVIGDYTALRVNSTTSGQMYLKYASYGDYNGKGFEKANEYSTLLADQYSLNYLTAIALGNYGNTMYDVKIQSFIQSYALPSYSAIGDGYDIQVSDIRYYGDTSVDYTVGYYTDPNYSSLASLVGNLGEYTEDELMYRSFVKENYLYVDEETLAYMKAIINEKGFSADDPEIVKKVADFISSSAKYNLKYDTALDNESNIVIAFLNNYKEGICQHYAAAATVLFRSLGIPARYTVGYSASSVANTWTDVKANQGHAWTEIYIDGLGWITVEVTAGGPGGSGNSSNNGGLGDSGNSGDSNSGNETPDGSEIKSFSITPVSKYMPYDGVTVLTPDQKLVTLPEELQNAGYTYTVKITGSRLEPGISYSTIEEFRLFDATGNDITENYKITFNRGKLQVYVEELIIISEGASKTYDGTPLTNDNHTIEGTLMPSHTMAYHYTSGSITNVGKSANIVSIRIVDANGNDVTSWYKLTARYGMLEIKGLEIHIVADSAEKNYDGTALVAPGYTMVGELLEGNSIDVEISGSQTNIGRCDNVVTSVIITDNSGKNVTSNYIITYEKGLLRVTS